MDTVDLLASGSDYGHSSGGYGIDCNSALALLGLLGLIELLRDLIDQFVPPPTGRRLKRDLGIPSSLSPGLKSELPGVIFPLLHSMVDVNDGYLGRGCLARSVCEANRVLTTDDQLAAQLVAKLITQVAGDALVRQDSGLLEEALDAGHAGRNGTDCAKRYHSCDLQHFYKAKLTRARP